MANPQTGNQARLTRQLAKLYSNLMNKKSNDKPVTGSQLESGLEKLGRKLIGRTDQLDKKIDQREMSLRTEIRITAEETKKEIKKEFSGLATREDICQFKDDIITELVKIRETTDILLGRYPQMQNNLENHETRIGKLETRIFL